MTESEATYKRDEFDAIRAQIKQINYTFGGQVEFSEWAASDGEVLKVVMTFKKPSSYNRVKQIKIAL